MNQQHFRIQAVDPASYARRAVLHTRHGLVQTPAFMPAGPAGAVNALTPAQLCEIGSQILPACAWSLNLRPGNALIRELGGLHHMMGWDGSLLTSSGSSEAFSQASFHGVTDDGVEYYSPVDDSLQFLGPKESMQHQLALGTDIALALDVPVLPGADREAAALAINRTLCWAEICRNTVLETGWLDSGHHVFGVVQGGVFPELRRSCAEGLALLGFSGYAIGGLGQGEPDAETLKQVEASTAFLPVQLPRLAHGAGNPVQLLQMIARGVDLFESTLPLQLASEGIALTSSGGLNLHGEEFRRDGASLMEGLENYTCRNFCRAWLHHLVTTNQTLGCTLLALHNVHFLLDLMGQARDHIDQGDYAAWHRDWCERYEGAATAKA